MALTTTDLDRMANDDRWLGFGYLGERRNVRESVADGESPASRLEELATADAALIAKFNELGMDYESAFEWANSRDGRHFADEIFGWGSTDEHIARAFRHYGPRA